MKVLLIAQWNLWISSLPKKVTHCNFKTYNNQFALPVFCLSFWCKTQLMFYFYYFDTLTYSTSGCTKLWRTLTNSNLTHPTLTQFRQDTGILTRLWDGIIFKHSWNSAKVSQLRKCCFKWTYAYWYPLGFQQVFIHILWVNRKKNYRRSCVIVMQGHRLVLKKLRIILILATDLKLLRG